MERCRAAIVEALDVLATDIGAGGCSTAEELKGAREKLRIKEEELQKAKDHCCRLSDQSQQLQLKHDEQLKQLANHDRDKQCLYTLSEKDNENSRKIASLTNLNHELTLQNEQLKCGNQLMVNQMQRLDEVKNRNQELMLLNQQLHRDNQSAQLQAHRINDLTQELNEFKNRNQELTRQNTLHNEEVKQLLRDNAHDYAKYMNEASDHRAELERACHIAADMLQKLTKERDELVAREKARTASTYAVGQAGQLQLTNVLKRFNFIGEFDDTSSGKGGEGDNIFQATILGVKVKILIECKSRNPNSKKVRSLDKDDLDKFEKDCRNRDVSAGFLFSHRPLPDKMNQILLQDHAVLIGGLSLEMTEENEMKITGAFLYALLIGLAREREKNAKQKEEQHTEKAMTEMATFIDRVKCNLRVPLKQLSDLSLLQYTKIPELAETLRMLPSGAEAARILVPDTRKLATDIYIPPAPFVIQENNKRKAPSSEEMPALAVKQQRFQLQSQEALVAASAAYFAQISK